jgi:hypothetical protein
MVLPIDIQTVVSQIANVGKIQQTQQMASLELLKEQNIQDAKKVKANEELVESTRETEQGAVGDATQGSGGGQGFTGQKKEEEGKDEVPPSATKGKIIDTLG